MKMSKAFFSWLGLMAGLAVVLLPSAALAQDSDNSGALGAALGGVMLFVLLAFCAAMYVYWALALQTIAKKTNTEPAWLAWIPIANIFLILMVAQKPMWWFILFLIPIVSLVMSIIVFMAVAERRGKPSWWGVMIIVPIMNLIMPGYLAWAD